MQPLGLGRDRFTGVTKAARDLGLREDTLRRACASGQLPSYVFGQRVRVRVTDVRAWIETHRRVPR